jgi:hypothetical protein
VFIHLPCFLPVLRIIMSNMYGVALWISLGDVHLLIHSLVNTRLYVIIVRRKAAHHWHQDQCQDHHHPVSPLLASQEYLLKLQSDQQSVPD